MPAFFESARVVMVTVRKWGGVSLGADSAPAETGRIYNKELEVRSEGEK